MNGRPRTGSFFISGRNSTTISASQIQRPKRASLKASGEWRGWEKRGFLEVGRGKGKGREGEAKQGERKGTEEGEGKDNGSQLAGSD